jgi:hypothetical protein
MIGLILLLGIVLILSILFILYRIQVLITGNALHKATGSTPFYP